MRSSLLRAKQTAVFAILAAVIMTAQITLSFLPSIQLTGLFISAITVTYRAKALIPVYVFVLLYLLYYGFFTWNLPHLYIWIPLWGMFMIAPKVKMPQKARVFVYAFLCGLYGLSFGTLYSPVWAIVANLNFKQLTAWIIAGLPTDIAHAVCNFTFGFLIIPLSNLFKKLERV